MTDLNVFQAHNIVHQALDNADVPDDVIAAWLQLTDILFPEDEGFVVEFTPDAVLYDAIDEVQNAKPVLTLVPDEPA